MAFRQRREKLRSILNGSTCIRPGSVYDATSIRIAEDLGFELGMFGGSVASLVVLGDPDIALITLTELAEQMRRMSRASALPVLVDADHGYGNALNVRRTVQELETAGAAGLTIEDTLLPQAFGQPGTQLISLEEGVGKMKAALDGRSDPSLVIMGRTGARVRHAVSTTRSRGRRRMRRPASMRCSSPASRTAASSKPFRPQRRCRSCSAARPRTMTALDYLAEPARADRVAGPRAVRRRHASRL